MCRECWEDFGRAKVDTPRVREAAVAIGEVYGYDDDGWHLYTIIADWNLDNGNLDWCGWAIAKNVNHAGREQLECEARCLALLRSLTLDERASALALHDGFWGDLSIEDGQ